MLIRRTFAAASAVAGLVTLALSPVAAGSTPASAAVPAGGVMTPLDIDIIPGLAALTPQGAVPAGQEISVNLDLTNPNRAAEQALDSEIYNPESPEYHQFLTPSQFAADFAAPASQLSAAESWATRDGLTVTRVASTNDLVSLTGSAAEVEQTFGVQLNDYLWHGLPFYANAAAPEVPAGLGIYSVDGLNSAQRMVSDQGSDISASTPHGSSPSQDNCVPSGSPCVGVTTPNDIRSVYDAPAGDQGQGQTAAVFGEGNFNAPISDLRLFETHYGLPHIPVKVILSDPASTNPSAYSDTSGDIEWDLDTQAITGVAPDIQSLDLYFGTSLVDAQVEDMFSAWADDPKGPLQANASFGECEYNPANSSLPAAAQFAAGQGFTIAAENTLTQANMEGRTLFASAGDTGSSCPVLPVDVNGVGNEAVPDVEYPCASPEAVCVGGTVLYTTGGDTPADPNPSLHASRALEYSWTFSGGGLSYAFDEPTWQQSVSKYSAINGSTPCLYDDQGNPNTSATMCRTVPDVAAQSGDVATNGYSIYISGSLSEEGGTSLSSPLNVGMWTLDQAAAPKTKHGYTGNGYANPDFYSHEGDFFDIGGGTTSPPTSNGYFDSGPGYDLVSGLGVQDIDAMSKAINAGNDTPTHDVIPTDKSSCEDYLPGGSGSPDTLLGACVSKSSKVDPACVSLFTGMAGESSYPPLAGSDSPQLDILAGNMHNTATTLTGILTVEDLQTGPTAVPAGGTAVDYFLFWNWNNTKYYLQAEINATGESFFYGDETSGTGGNTLNELGTATGTVNAGSNGTIVMSVPLSDVGSPVKGDTLTSPSGETDVLEGVPSTTVLPGDDGEYLIASTVAPQYNYKLGEVCKATGQPGSDGGS